MKTCNVEYKDPETGQKRICQSNEPLPAKYQRAGLYVCTACYGEVLQYLGKGAPLGTRAAMQALKVIR